ncbi:MAG: hypothetical protein PHF38_03430, partial [Bacteroidales bacterium]|nr:hypothetical protein [Bacteroidales bacterium]
SLFSYLEVYLITGNNRLDVEKTATKIRKFLFNIRLAYLNKKYTFSKICIFSPQAFFIFVQDFVYTYGCSGNQ